jgi:flagellar hook-associated protein 2
MPGVIAVGGLATGLDTNKLIDGLVQIRSQPLDLLNIQLSDVQATQTSFASLSSKFAALRTAVQALDTASEFFVRKASSSDEDVASAAAGSGATAGSVAITVSQLARVSVASSASGVGASTSTIAAGAGSFTFKVGSGADQTVALTAATTLDDLVTGINNLNAGVTASAVNLGTSASPDYRLQLTSTATGSANNITIVTDNTTLGVANTQTGLDAQFTIAGFTGTFNRESNTFSDVLNGVTFNLKATGTTTITVIDDAEAITTKVKAFVDAVNGVKSFVAAESQVTRNADKSVTIGSLATSSTARRLTEQLQSFVSSALAGADTQYVNLSSIGIATQTDGTLKFDESAFKAALADDPTAVAELFGGNGTANGIANDIEAFVDNATNAGGSIFLVTSQLSKDVTSLLDQIDAEQRAIDAFKADLSAEFVALESLVGSLQQTSAFLTQAFG